MLTCESLTPPSSFSNPSKCESTICQCQALVFPLSSSIILAQTFTPGHKYYRLGEDRRSSHLYLRQGLQPWCHYTALTTPTVLSTQQFPGTGTQGPCPSRFPVSWVKLMLNVCLVKGGHKQRKDGRKTAKNIYINKKASQLNKNQEKARKKDASKQIVNRAVDPNQDERKPWSDGNVKRPTFEYEIWTGTSYTKSGFLNMFSPGVGYLKGLEAAATQGPWAHQHPCIGVYTPSPRTTAPWENSSSLLWTMGMYNTRWARVPHHARWQERVKN